MNNLRTISQGVTSLESVTFSNKGDAPLVLQEVKDYLRQGSSADDTLIDVLISDVIEDYSRIMNRSLLTQTVTALYSSYGREVKLPYGNVTALTTVKIEEKGVKTVIDSSKYYLSGNTLYFNEIYENQNPYEQPKLEVIYTANGWESSIGGLLKQAILSSYEDRQDNVMGVASRIYENSRKRALRYKLY